MTSVFFICELCNYKTPHYDGSWLVHLYGGNHQRLAKANFEALQYDTEKKKRILCGGCDDSSAVFEFYSRKYGVVIMDFLMGDGHYFMEVENPEAAERLEGTYSINGSHVNAVIWEYGNGSTVNFNILKNL